MYTRAVSLAGMFFHSQPLPIELIFSYCGEQGEQGRDETFLLHDGPPYANGSLHIGSIQHSLAGLGRYSTLLLRPCTEQDTERYHQPLPHPAGPEDQVTRCV